MKCASFGMSTLTQNEQNIRSIYAPTSLKSLETKGTDNWSLLNAVNYQQIEKLVFLKRRF